MLAAFRVLARFKHLRGTKWDIFGRTEERRTERQLIADYTALVAELVAGLTAQNHPLALSLARIPEKIRGFGHVKERHLAEARQEEAQLLAAWRTPRAPLGTPLATAAE